MQGLWRTWVGRRRLLSIARRVWEIGFDAESESYFYYNKATGVSTWETPLVLRRAPPYRTDPEATRAAARMQSAFRSKVARTKLGATVAAVFQKEYDPESKEFYFLNKNTGEARWSQPKRADGVALGGDSSVMHQRDQEIERLKQQLEDKDAEIRRVRQETFNRLGREVRVQRVADALKGAKRSRNMDAWRNEQVVAWFIDMDLSEHVPALVSSRVTGLLLLNMDDDDLRELGITKRIHLRTLDVALRKYRRRYHEQAEADDDDDDAEDEDLSVSSTSSAGKSEEDSGNVHEVADEHDLLPTEEELMQLDRDRNHISKLVTYPGDDRTYPDVGDIIRCHCVAKVLDDDREIENTRKKKAPLEFVLGIGQAILGIDRGLVHMSFGERSTLTIKSEYAYGAQGLEPLVPPHATLLFDIELLRWRQRPPWNKPLIQQPGLSERPYSADDDDEDVLTRYTDDRSRDSSTLESKWGDDGTFNTLPPP